MMILLSLGQVVSSKKIWNHIDQIKLRKITQLILIQLEKPINNQINFSKSIDFKHISFAYPGKERNILNDINLSFKKVKICNCRHIWELVRLTLLKLILRYYDSYLGSITFDEYDYHQINDSSV